MPQDIAPQQQHELPRLREDLILVPGPRTRDGAPTWTIHDPVRNRYHRIGREAHDLLTFWHLGTAEAVARAVEKANGRLPSPESLAWMLHFLHSNFLLQRRSGKEVASLKQIAAATKRAWYTTLLHQYLFFRIPLVRPQRFLEATRFIADFLFSRTFLVIIAVLGTAGIFLTARQWDGFLATFLHFFSWQGLVWYGGALVLAKVLHELGHAYAATRAGCRVPTMGIAFLVMWPVLYTDTSDAWRLVDKKQRLLIGAAGMLTEMGLALLATFAWSFLPEGPMKSAAFVVAGITWIMTLAVNLNPLMRFDGYYLLSDVLDVENLQDRSFARAKWWLRETLFGFGEVEPEPFPKGLGQFLIAFAFCVWIYRLLLFVGIAVLVYGFFFKLLGIVLFVVEIGWFVLLPVWNELREIWKRRTRVRPNRHLLITGAGLVLLVLALFAPWRTSIDMPAFVDAAELSQVFPPKAARIAAIAVERNQPVSRGQTLFTLEEDGIDFEIGKVTRQIEMREELVRREAAGGAERARIRVLRSDLESDRARLDGLVRKRDLLTIRAGMSGQVVDIDEHLSVGMWVNDRTRLATLADMKTPRIVAYASEDTLDSLRVGAKAVFFPDALHQDRIEARITEIAPVNTPYLEEPYLASIFGGPIAVEMDVKKRLIPLRGIYRISLEPVQSIPTPKLVLRGTVLAEGPGRSIADSILRKIYQILIRESAF